MAIHYDRKLKRFRDDATGHFVSQQKAMRSSVARREYQAAQTLRETRQKRARRVAAASPSESFDPSTGKPAPWLFEGSFTTPGADEWFDGDTWGDLMDWGDYDDEETDS